MKHPLFPAFRVYREPKTYLWAVCMCCTPFIGPRLFGLLFSVTSRTEIEADRHLFILSKLPFLSADSNEAIDIVINVVVVNIFYKEDIRSNCRNLNIQLFPNKAPHTNDGLVCTRTEVNFKSA